MDVVAPAWTITAMGQGGGQKQKADSEGVHDDGSMFVSGSSSVLTVEGISISGLIKNEAAACALGGMQVIGLDRWTRM